MSGDVEEEATSEYQDHVHWHVVLDKADSDCEWCCPPIELAIDASLLHRQRRFSLRAFGPGSRPKAVVDHIEKELAEVLADPGDLEEWIDVMILAADGAWRAGYEPEEIIDAYVAKLEKNEGREWPDWREADPEKAIEHVRGDE